MKMKSDEKVLRAIKATEYFIKGNEKYPSVDENLNFTIMGCEKRNLEAYREMLGQDKRKLTGWLRELYQAI